MAQITGSSTIDWSGVTLEPIDFEQKFNDFSSRLDQVVTEIENGQFFFNSPPTDTFISLTLFSGGLLTFAGSGLLSGFPVINSFDYSNPFTGDVARFAGTLDFVGNEVFNSFTIGVPGLKVTIIGNIVEDPLGNTSGSISQLKVTFGSTAMTIKGSLVVDANFDISGTVTRISVLSGTNSIVMTGLSLPYDALDSVTTANDLFAVVGNQLAGNDTITYTNNSSVGMTFFGGAGNDTITISGPNTDTLNGGTGNDILKGGLGQDTINGDAGDDRITMLVTAGNEDTIDAGADTDTLVLSGVVPGDHVVVVDLSSSTDQVISIGGVLDDTLAQVNFENLTATGLGSSVNVTGSDGDNVIIGSSGNDSIDGGASNDTLRGGAGSDTLDGGTGNDTLIGGTGNDTYTVDSVGDVVTEVLIAGTDKVFSSIDYTLGANVENLELTGSALNGTGNGLANVLTGNSGVNILTGGAGNDTYLVQNDTDSVVENLNAGIDLVQSAAASFTLGANVEKLTLIDSTDSSGTGNALANVLTGNSGHNQLSGEAGSDKLIGGDGDDLLLGGLGNDILIGGNGVDNLNGGAGPDNMAGGTNDDTYTVDSAGDVVTETLIAGTDQVFASLNYKLGANVENLELTGSALNGTGNALANVITGNNGHNRLSGLAGNDQLDGGDGNDILIGGLGQDSVNGGVGDDQITLLVTAGNVDAIDAGADTDTLVLSGVVPGDHVVVVDLSSSIDQVVSIGGTLDDTLTQVNFENLTATGLGSSVNVTGSDGDNSIIGASGNDSITGGAGNDTLRGDAGGDTLDGGIGNDTLIGGTGNDIFLFGLGDGQDLVRDSSGTADKILYDAGINPLDLVISRQANDLQLAIHGSSDQITVQNWYTSSGNRTETIQAGNGQTLVSTQVNQLIQAMAGFTQQTGLSWDAASGGAGDPGQQAQFQGIIAANWQS